MGIGADTRMTHFDTGFERDTDTVVRAVLQTVAASSEPAQGMGNLLEMARALTEAEMGVVVLFDEAHLVVTSGIAEVGLPDLDALAALSEGLSAGLHLDPDLPPDLVLRSPHNLFSPMRHGKTTVGLLWLGFTSPGMVGVELLGPLLDGLMILTRNARATARHEKITRNQHEFMRIVLHDLRSPLTSMQGFASMLESGTVGEVNEQQKHFVSKILSGIAQMTSLVENVQDAGRYDPETGFYEMQRAPCDLVDMVQRIVHNHLVPAEKGELTITTAISEAMPIISADATMLERAMTNLIDNAIKYTPNRGQVEVGLQRDGEAIIFSVRDSGLGISAENQKQLFERHYRIPRNEHKKIKGSGLGLFIVRSVAQRHGGQAWVESNEGQGSTFYISIPLVSNQNHAARG
jgi:signal transduction histidine kinase